MNWKANLAVHCPWDLRIRRGHANKKGSVADQGQAEQKVKDRVRGRGCC